MKIKFKAFLVLLVIALLASCGFGDEECLFGQTCEPEPVPLPTGATLDCDNLDPDKVYLHGTLAEGSATEDALVDPLDPTSFCVGFEERTIEGVITTDGRYIYERDLNFFLFEQDALQPDQGSSVDEIWDYPGDTQGNDVLLHTSTATGCGVRLVMINPSNNDLFYSCPNDTIHTEAASPYYSLGNDDLIAVTNDGSMLVGGTFGMRLVANDLTETELTLPTTVGYNTLRIHAAKLYVNPNTANDSIWIALEGFNDGSLRRWSVDLVTLTVTDQGPFADLPANTNGGIFSSRMDGNGDLWQLGNDATTVSVDLIIERPIASDGVPSAVVYSEADLTTTNRWTRENFPEVRIHISYLVTGS